MLSRGPLVAEVLSSNSRQAVTLACALVVALFTSACGSSAISTSDATQFWRQTVSKHYGNGVVARGDGRGCVNTRSDRWSCTAYVRNAENSLSLVSGGNMTAHGHRATSREIQNWFARAGGGINP